MCIFGIFIQRRTGIGPCEVSGSGTLRYMLYSCYTNVKSDGVHATSTEKRKSEILLK